MDCVGTDVVCVVGEVVRSLWSLWGLKIAEVIISLQSIVVASKAEIKDIVGLAIASIGAWKWWQNRDSVIFRRLHRILEQEDGRIRHARADMLRILQRPGPREQFDKPLYVENELKEVFARRGWRSIFLRRLPRLSKVDDILNKALEKIAAKEELLEPCRAMYQHQKFSALMIQGTVAAARAQRTKSSQVQSALRASAIEKFENAERVPGYEDDLDALELLTLQLMAQGHFQDARIVCERLIENATEDVSGSRKTALQLVRAKKLTAQSHFMEGAGLQAANAILKEALEDDLPIGELSRRDQLDKAQTHELHSRIRFASNFAGVGLASLHAAEDAYKLLRQQCGRNRDTWSWGEWRKLRARVYQTERAKMLEEARLGLARCEDIRRERNLPSRI